MNQQTCFFCGSQSTTTRCKDCPAADVWHCRRHAGTHRPPGSGLCLPVRVVAGGDAKGRFLVASRNVSRGEILVLDEAALVVPDDRPVCLVCCKRCRLPVCGSADCIERLPSSDHRKYECPVFEASKISAGVAATPDGRHFAFNCVAILRTVLKWKEEGPDGDITRMQSHWDERQKDPAVRKAMVGIAEFLNRLLYDDSTSAFELSEVGHVFGVLRTNSVSFPGSDPEKTAASALYPLVMVASHACFPNAETLPQTGSKFGMRAARDIKAGEEITVRYRSTLDHRLILRSDLRRQWLFDCACSRCRDPTDGGTFMSSARCLKCQEGYLLPEEALDCNSDWICDNCEEVLTASVVTRLEEEAAETEEKLADQPAAVAIAALEGRLHPRHHRMMKLKLSHLKNFSDYDDPKKCADALRYCDDVLFVADRSSELDWIRATVLRCKVKALLAAKARERTEKLKLSTSHSRYDVL